MTDPRGWILVGYTLDPRTGMAHYRDYFNTAAAAIAAPEPRNLRPPTRTA